MDINSRVINQRGKYIVDLPTIGLVFIVGLSFLLHLFTRVFSGYAYAILLFAFTLIYILSRKIIIRRGNEFALTWIISIVILVLSFLHSQRSNGALLDVIVFTCGFLLIIFCSENAGTYLRCLAVIKAFAVFFAAGVILQRFIPPIYRIIIQVFPSAYRSSLISSGGSGFTLNSGYTAGYIIAGLFVAISLYKRENPGYKKIMLPLFLLLGLLLTVKRGPTFFFILTVIYCYLAPVKSSKKMKRYWTLFLIVAFALIVLFAFRDALSSIPIVGKILDTIAGVINGEDVTTGRTRLYLWALELFRRNPIFGIGWGRYRTTVVGNVTLVKDFETHNIYLQLLAETGIIGFIAFVTTFLIFWNTTRIAYCKCVQNNNLYEANWRKLLYFSLAYQTYFLLYGLTGNPLYDPHFQLMYIFSCVIIAAYSIAKRNMIEI